MKLDLTECLKIYTKRVNDFLATKLPAEPNNILHQAMRYSALNGGKRLRPLLVYTTGISLDGNPAALDIPACAVELIHCYSLIHDDLPAMDNDDLRRGKPTCHKAFNEGIAILAGDALQVLSFEILSEASAYFTAKQQIQMIKTLTKACSAMAKGQALDISTQSQCSLAELSYINQAKTGALIEASVQLGVIAANCEDQKVLNNLSQFSQCLGLAFQINDDVLDIEGSIKELGKAPGSDRKQNKTTYPAILGIEKSKLKVRKLYEASIQYLRGIKLENSLLAELAYYILLMTQNS